MTNKRCQSGVRSETGQDVDVVTGNRLLVQMNSATLSHLRHGIDDQAYVLSLDGPLPTPRMPGDVDVKPGSFVRPTLDADS